MFAIWDNLFCSPEHWGPDHYYSGIGSLLEWMQGRGIYPWLVGSCDQVDGSRVKFSSTEALVAHVSRLVDIQRTVDTGLFEISNEDWKNGLVAKLFPASLFTGLPTIRSAPSPIATSLDEAGPLIDATTSHTARGSEWARKAKDLYDASSDSGRPSLAGEPDKLDNVSPSSYADYMAVCDLFGSGGIIHGGFRSLDPRHLTDLQNCVAPRVGEYGYEHLARIAETWTLGGIPDTAASQGRYIRGTDHDDGDLAIHHTDCPAAHCTLRTFAMEEPGKQTIVQVDANDMPVTTKPGWAVTITANVIHAVKVGA